MKFVGDTYDTIMKNISLMLLPQTISVSIWQSIKSTKIMHDVCLTVS